MAETAASVLSKAAAETRWSSLPQTVRDQTEDLFLDTIAVSAAGLVERTYATVVAVLTREDGLASVPGLPYGVPVNTAVQVNGGATTVLQLQDGHRMGRGHPASHIVLVLLALAEETEADADSVLEAMVAGYEVGARVGIAFGGLHPLLHDTGSWSTVATAAAAAHLLSDGDQTVIEAAIETAAAVALMPFCNLPIEGASAHHLYIGIGATTGLTAARSALAGMEPLPGTLEAFLGPRAGAAFDSNLLTAGVGDDGRWSIFEIENAYFKIHPTCAHLHGANDAILAIISTHGLEADDIGTIEVATYAAGLKFDNETPENALAARFSLRASTAIAVCRRVLDETTLTDEALCDPMVQDVMARIHVRHDPNLDQHYPAGRPARVTVTCKDGTVWTEHVVFPRGDHANPLPRKDRRAKVQRLLERRFSKPDADALVTSFERYFAGGPIGGVTAALRTSKPAQTGT